ncbi:hypothetical protein [Lysobacter sp. 22409]|uniref:hypothetical protein n=1 Tax=Lysobacter sp. 22409 TaxID=3453917 RepID=UPI003F8732DC
MRISYLIIFIGCAFLGACSAGLRDEQIRSDFFDLQKKGEIKSSGGITKIIKGDGWDDGAEVRVHFCQQAPPQQCKETHASLSYQKRADGSWKLISVGTE